MMKKVNTTLKKCIQEKQSKSVFPEIITHYKQIHFKRA